MKKGVYFGIQIVWSFILSFVIWFLLLMGMSSTANGKGSADLAGMLILAGVAIYLVVTVIYIVIGHKKVKDWKVWMIFVSILISAGAGFLGMTGSAFIPEWINKLIK